ncbi:helix-hairpin-helix domain-containing protein [Mesobacillus zeae]|uniref:Helix-hairpin-helix DNA-binding motif class 1 domain-containing protein n=1 Tax=Mesobacillus zeae TaxID=1917180 RepID=A0A398B7A1_9BACI|nr:helix-hairpin-helix domain-containing protein [Mesobacillus zeae]RID83780.1 hypothetical protein D1970_14315 [Mesobacillus zeae]
MADWLKEHKIHILAGTVALMFVLVGYFKDEGGLEAPSAWTGEDRPIEAFASNGDGQQPAPAGDANNDPGQSSPMEVASQADMMADIKGAVRKPGVYNIRSGDRMADLVEKAGGVTEDAETAAINFAMKVTDEMAVYIPRKGEESIMPAPGGEASPQGGGGQQVNLNTATETELDTLPGIGPAKAAAIIEYRETNGPFKSTEGLKEISGIGDKTFEKLASQITVN